MSFCINFNSPEVIKLAEQLNLDKRVVAAKIGVWQAENNTTSIPTLEQLSNASIKPGVQELFESNPELANSVYEALGIVVPKDIKVKGKVFYAGKEFPNTFQITFETNDGKYIGFAKVSNKNIDSIELQPEFRKKGLGTQIYVLLGEELANKGITLESANYTGTGPLSSQAKSLWESLVRKAYAVKTENNYKFVSKVQQKQQAQQLYSQYLDTIFPDSKIKDIVYHGSPNANKIKENGFKNKQERDKGYIGDGYYFTKDLSWQSFTGDISGTSKDTSKRVTVVLNAKNPQLINTEEDRKNLLNKPNVDSRILLFDYNQDLTIEDAIKEGEVRFNLPVNEFNEMVVFEPEQIHILGSKQDIEGFKQFANNSITPLDEYFDDERYTPIFASEGISSKEQLKNLNEEQLGKIIKKLCQI